MVPLLFRTPQPVMCRSVSVFIPGTDTAHTQVLSLRLSCNQLAYQKDRFPKPLAVVHIQEKLLLGLLFRTAPPACVLSVSFIRDHFTTEMMLGFASLLLDCCCAYPQGKVVLFVVQGLSLKIHL